MLDDMKAIEDVAQLKLLFDRLEIHRHAGQLMNAVEDANGLRIFIGSDHQPFSRQDVLWYWHPIGGVIIRLSGLLVLSDHGI